MSVPLVIEFRVWTSDRTKFSNLLPLPTSWNALSEMTAKLTQNGGQLYGSFFSDEKFQYFKLENSSSFKSMQPDKNGIVYLKVKGEDENSPPIILLSSRSIRPYA
jgi:hypothetical protein